MTSTDLTPETEALELCVDELDELLRRLDRYPPALRAEALRRHLQALLQRLLESRLSTRGEVRELLGELERQTLPEL